MAHGKGLQKVGWPVVMAVIGVIAAALVTWINLPHSEPAQQDRLVTISALPAASPTSQAQAAPPTETRGPLALRLESSPPLGQRLRMQGISFATGTATLTPEARAHVQNIAQDIIATNRRFRVIGLASDAALGERRSEALIDALLTAGVPGRQLAVGAAEAGEGADLIPI